jgi:hypothetical protein
MGLALSCSLRAGGLRLGRRGLILGLLFASACSSKSAAGEEETSGGEWEGATARIDDAGVKALFPAIGDASRIRTCAPEPVTWVILAYAPEVLDKHRVRTREIHCDERLISERCELESEVMYYLDDPDDYFKVDPRLPPERALEIAELSEDMAEGGRLVAIALSTVRGVYLLTLARCGAEAQYAVRLKESSGERKLEVIDTVYNVELEPYRDRD